MAHLSSVHFLAHPINQPIGHIKMMISDVLAGSLRLHAHLQQKCTTASPIPHFPLPAYLTYYHQSQSPYWRRKRGAYEGRRNRITVLGQNTTAMDWRRAVHFSGGDRPRVSKLVEQIPGEGRGHCTAPYAGATEFLLQTSSVCHVKGNFSLILTTSWIPALLPSIYFHLFQCFPDIIMGKWVRLHQKPEADIILNLQPL